jgi:hypothetical protein
MRRTLFQSVSKSVLGQICLKINPKYTVESFHKQTAYKDRAYVDTLVSLLVKAGLPEKLPLP